jgi:hypothetical protein
VAIKGKKLAIIKTKLDTTKKTLEQVEREFLGDVNAL